MEKMASQELQELHFWLPTTFPVDASPALLAALDLPARTDPPERLDHLASQDLLDAQAAQDHEDQLVRRVMMVSQASQDSPEDQEDQERTERREPEHQDARDQPEEGDPPDQREKTEPREPTANREKPDPPEDPERMDAQARTDAPEPLETRESPVTMPHTAHAQLAVSTDTKLLPLLTADDGPLPKKFSVLELFAFILISRSRNDDTQRKR